MKKLFLIFGLFLGVMILSSLRSETKSTYVVNQDFETYMSTNVVNVMMGCKVANWCPRHRTTECYRCPSCTHTHCAWPCDDNFFNLVGTTCENCQAWVSCTFYYYGCCN